MCESTHGCAVLDRALCQSSWLHALSKHEALDCSKVMSTLQLLRLNDRPTGSLFHTLYIVQPNTAFLACQIAHCLMYRPLFSAPQRSRTAANKAYPNACGPRAAQRGAPARLRPTCARWAPRGRAPRAAATQTLHWPYPGSLARRGRRAEEHLAQRLPHAPPAQRLSYPSGDPTLAHLRAEGAARKSTSRSDCCMRRQPSSCAVGSADCRTSGTLTRRICAPPSQASGARPCAWLCAAPRRKQPTAASSPRWLYSPSLYAVATQTSATRRSRPASAQSAHAHARAPPPSNKEGARALFGARSACARLGAADQEEEAGHGLHAVEGGDVGHVVKLIPDVVLQEAHARALPGRLPPAAGQERRALITGLRTHPGASLSDCTA